MRSCRAASARNLTSAGFRACRQGASATRLYASGIIRDGCCKDNSLISTATRSLKALPRRRAEEPSSTPGAAGGSNTRTSPPPPPEARPPQAPITWKSALLALGACGVVLAYFEFEKAKRKPRIEIAVAGTPSIGGPFTLVDQDGHVVTNHTFRGRYMLVYFGFTFCPDICPAELAKVTKTLKILEEEEGITPGLVVPVFISVDPYRDTVGKIRSYLKDFHPSFVGLTGTPQQVESMARSFRVYSSTSQHSEEDEDYLVDHSIFLYLMDKEGSFLSHHGSQYDAHALAQRIATDVRSKLKERGSNFVATFIH
ncbi:electron transport SCO1/SenC family protein [Acanthamoeba castellanii str. Neff]|uniref:Electron transport SCO1/SenC family protein n=1 Tax=Acanthamoeba castellanii (strain ATCC 30010 / Neff) TaxID=1257118 RepID=L8H7Q3_ACACF|nr:electron transport SCO1/SenC family protein [Acanthamoeba castellanii str. Neff]ELR21272.1 electron transport SCO1/SenC family protein [Acanthamoeba castellanii str. Neff]